MKFGGENHNSLKDATRQLVVPAQGVFCGRQMLQTSARVLQQHPHEPGVQHPRRVQGAVAADGGEAEGHATGGKRVQEDSKYDTERADQLINSPVLDPKML